MKRLSVILLLFFLFIQTSTAKEPTFLQYFFSIKKVLPSARMVALLIPGEVYQAQQQKIMRAAKQSKLKVEVFRVSDTRSIGQQMKLVKDVDILLVYNAPVLTQKASVMFILSKSKDKQIPVISASQDYIKSGALIGLTHGENNRTQLVLNLKHTPYLASHFTDDVLQKIRAAQIIR